MPTWNKYKNCYDEQDITVARADYSTHITPGEGEDLPIPKAELDAQKREETFRTALLNELNCLTMAVRDLADE